MSRKLAWLLVGVAIVGVMLVGNAAVTYLSASDDCVQLDPRAEGLVTVRTEWRPWPELWCRYKSYDGRVEATRRLPWLGAR